LQSSAVLGELIHHVWIRGEEAMPVVPGSSPRPVGWPPPQPFGQIGVGRDAVRNLRVADLALGSHESLSHRRLGDEEGAGDLGCLQPADEP
jgi:hypothetical protein